MLRIFIQYRSGPAFAAALFVAAHFMLASLGGVASPDLKPGSRVAATLTISSTGSGSMPFVENTTISGRYGVVPPNDIKLFIKST